MMTTIILISGAILTGITIGLFSLINLEIYEFYFKYIVVWGIAASPIVGTYLVQTNPQLVNNSKQSFSSNRKSFYAFSPFDTYILSIGCNWNGKRPLQ